MNSVNFNQLLCKSVSNNGENITGIFDTLVCEKGTNTICICVLSTQILNDYTSHYDKYYYRIILRRFGNSREDMKNYRIDSGVIWEDVPSILDRTGHDIISEKRTITRPGSSVRLIIEYEHDFEMQGNHEIDLYVKKIDGTETQEDCEKLPVKSLELASICPFQVIFPNG